jgi:hypothetical protein
MDKDHPEYRRTIDLDDDGQQNESSGNARDTSAEANES